MYIHMYVYVYIYTYTYLVSYSACYDVIRGKVPRGGRAGNGGGRTGP